MARKTSQKEKLKTLLKPVKPAMPNFPQHQFSEPYARLMTLGDGVFNDAYAEIAEELQRGDVQAAVDQLLEMALDETYYEYWEEEADVSDPRSWTRLHALRVLERMGPAAASATEPLLPLLEYMEDDWVFEEMPLVYAAIGEPAIEPLTQVLLNPAAEQSQRISAGEALAEIGEAHEDLRPRIIKTLEQALILQTDDPEIAGFLIGNLMDVGARESVPLMEQMFREGKVDEMIIQMANVEEHFDLPRVTPHKDWRVLYPERWRAIDPDAPREEEDEDDFDEEEYEEEEEDGDDVQVPYVAPPKVGRNEPCPCGSGKKYKKCCGA